MRAEADWRPSHFPEMLKMNLIPRFYRRRVPSGFLAVGRTDSSDAETNPNAGVTQTFPKGRWTSDLHRCEVCDGTGQIANDEPGLIGPPMTCPACSGLGVISTRPK